MPSYDNTLGAYFIGSLISGALFGLFTCQVYIYHKSFPEERKWIKYGLVNGMWLIEFGHTICTSHVVYFYAVTHFGDAEALFVSIPISLPVSLLFHSMVTGLAQSYYSYRILRFGNHHRYIIPVICLIITFFILLGDIAVAAMEAEIYMGKDTIKTYFSKMEWLVVTPLVLRTVVDLLTAATMVYYLRLGRNESAYKNTAAVLDKLILWTIETGVLTSMVGSLLLIFYLTNRSNYIWVAFEMILPKVFSNAMLANLNSRVGLREMQSTMVMGSEFEIRITDASEENMTTMQFCMTQSDRTVNSGVSLRELSQSELTKISNTETMA
ncbi:hypothetical protein GYMLUDRAFT_45236 [Collybiopsis luxurians FD-317 M1]|uniref:DUF6534 domain-containing protein n=1 Tax=Collybiopsis luxurians FD-317 M1 TaxID=944289 RepID=A0A0D0C839_9AGAR|nr:hypothetical protein GYMLUDRAFT_45236 [Collybiopsis luxurians FD-317 M1]